MDQGGNYGNAFFLLAVCVVLVLYFQALQQLPAYRLAYPGRYVINMCTISLASWMQQFKMSHVSNHLVLLPANHMAWC